MKKRIAIIGSGVSGLVSAYCLKNGLNADFQRDPNIPQFDVTLFEAEDRVGGHTATIDVELDNEHYAIDTGFIVYNDWTYPNFIRLMDRLGVQSQPTSMSFSVSCETTGLEYAGSNYNTLFAQRRNLFRPAYLKMLTDIVRFNKESIADVEAGSLPPQTSLGEYLDSRGYSEFFIDKYLVPMGAAIWSSGLQDMLEFPLIFFVKFFKNHGLLSIKERPQWRTLIGGSRSYISPLTESFRDSIRLSTDIVSLDRHNDNVHVRLAGGEIQRFDGVVIATHSDQALTLLEQPTRAEREILSAIPYQDNDVVLHTDARLLPQRKLAWSSWNYRIKRSQGGDDVAQLTYAMNILQNLRAKHNFCVSLNQTEAIDPDKIIGRYNYAHPVFTVEGIAAQERWGEVAGVKNTWFCGAYWRNGFHEDGVVSGMRAARAIQCKYAEENDGVNSVVADVG